MYSTIFESGTVNDISSFSLKKLTPILYVYMYGVSFYRYMIYIYIKMYIATHTLNSRAIFKMQRENINRFNNIVKNLLTEFTPKC